MQREKKRFVDKKNNENFTHLNRLQFDGNFLAILDVYAEINVAKRAAANFSLQLILDAHDEFALAVRRERHHITVERLCATSFDNFEMR